MRIVITFILNITPGTYEVRISYVGYAPKTIQEVESCLQTSLMNWMLNISTDFTLPDIVVVDKNSMRQSLQHC